MAKKRIELGPEAEAIITARMARGDSLDEICKDYKVSRATIARRMRELRGKVPAAKAALLAESRKKRAAPAPARPTGVEEGDSPAMDLSLDSTLREIDAQLEVAKQKAEEASALGNAEEHATYMRMVIALLEARRKATPAPKIDPNESPDMIAAAEAARTRLFGIAEKLLELASSPVGETISKLLHREREEAAKDAAAKAAKAALPTKGGAVKEQGKK